MSLDNDLTQSLVPFCFSLLLVLPWSMDLILQINWFFLVILSWHSRVCFLFCFVFSIKFYWESANWLWSYSGVFHGWIQKPNCVPYVMKLSSSLGIIKKMCFWPFLSYWHSHILTWTILHKWHLAFMPIWKTSYEPHRSLCT